MPRARISKRSVDALSCHSASDRVFLWDDAISGFGVAAFPTGRKAYVVQFRKDGRSRRVTIGEHGRLTPGQARSEARKLLGAIEQGVDPVAERKAARAVRTFGQVGDDFMRLHVEAKRKAGTGEQYRIALEKHIRPALGSKRMTEITRGDVSRLHSGMAATPIAANRAVAFISSVWKWAETHDEVDEGKNPTRGIERFNERSRERFLTTEELARLGDALSAAEARALRYVIDASKPRAKHAAKPENRVRAVDPYAVAAIRLLMLTGARLREILHARWDYVDLERGVLHLPDSKTGAKPIYLSAAAQAVISRLERVSGSPYLIPGAKAGMPRADLKKPWATITEAAGLQGLRIHDLRHSFASVGAGASLGLPIIGKLLGHSQVTTTSRYAHLDADPLHRAAHVIGATIEAAMSRRPSTEIVRIGRRQKT